METERNSINTEYRLVSPSPFSSGVRAMLVVEHLETHMRYYVPKGWVGKISEFDFVPYFTPEEFEVILAGNIPEKVTKWYMIAAIKDWQTKHLIIAK